MVSLLTFPQELLDEIVRRLDAASVVRFCRAVPQLNHIAETIVGTGQLLRLKISRTWPNLIITSDSAPRFASEIYEEEVKDLTTLVTRFHGYTKLYVGDLEQTKHIPAFCALASQNIQIDGQLNSENIRVWADHIVANKKRVLEISFFNLYDKPISWVESTAEALASLEIMSDSLARIDPFAIIFHGSTWALANLKLQSCRQMHTLTFRLMATECLPPDSLATALTGIPNLSVFNFDAIWADAGMEPVIDMAETMRNTNIKTITIKRPEDVEADEAEEAGFKYEIIDSIEYWIRK
ncbi:hypothetical protein BCR33DRAFT_721565 [Rhizoclosmatium globosum]|uniref:F-box domain-containing protein n=1 Tax=Rhizoclosmatium globosum TaxID=329046 RepID=A0A1Y2BR27_9FUNG|nr:hypothetical protein BCR33DRAFT_721565 [Rhizoclosmatium globosum]|eukprot:ORY37200.1 hypothetical protein BCR33DRAFT_721565 [Rhizoclosmatium globosum]